MKMSLTTRAIICCLYLTFVKLVTGDGGASGFRNDDILSTTLDQTTASRCEEISIPMCRGIGYNYTSMPNQFNHDTQEEAGLEVHQFWPLVEIQCSPDLKFFLCSMYAPICIEDYHAPLPACKSVCERAKAGCAPLMRQYGFAWPERMNCDKLPEYGDTSNLCMDAKNGSLPAGMEPESTYTSSTKRPTKKCKNKPCPNETKTVLPSSGEAIDCTCRCKNPLIPIERGDFRYNRSVSTGGLENCAMPCQNQFFSEEELNFGYYWVFSWSVICCFSSFLTVATFLIDMDRFRYPERPVVFLAGCYMMVSIGYITRIVMGKPEIACDGDMIRYTSNGAVACTVVFLLIYFFGMASGLWWVIMSFTWFLAAGLKWGNEAIAKYSQYFHMVAWFLPTIQSVTILIISAIDGDSVSGICFVGNQNPENLKTYVIIPLFIYLLLGISFQLAGFVSLIRIRNVIKQQGRAKAQKLEKLMLKLGIFNVLYTAPAVIVIGCYFYELLNYREWTKPLVCPCTYTQIMMRWNPDSHMSPPKPDFSIFMLKYFMSLVIGITSGFWIWSGKTLESWRKFGARLCGRKVATPGYLPPPLVPPALGPPLLPTPSPISQLHPSQRPLIKQQMACSVQSQLSSVHKHSPLSHV
ncbi:frizzled-5-like isoform X2 [Artemia franciscana]